MHEVLLQTKKFGRISIRDIRMELGGNKGLIMQANIMIIKERYMSFAFDKTACISKSCKLVPVQYQDYGLFRHMRLL